MKTFVLVCHSHIKGRSKKVAKHSEVWSDIESSAEKRAKELGVEFRSYCPVHHYHDIDEFLGLIKKAVKREPDFIALPFTAKIDQIKEILKDFKGKIIPVNVPVQYRDKRFLGYCGQDEYSAGVMVAKELNKVMTIKKIHALIILRHQGEHYGHELRIKGIKSITTASSIIEIQTGTTVLEEILKCKDIDFTIATLGNRGSEVALNLEEDILIMGMDLNLRIRRAIENGEMIGSVVQRPKKQGKNIIDIAWRNSKTNIYSGPYLVTKNNMTGY